MVKVGDRIELIRTDDPYTELRPGARGTVTDIRDAFGDTQVWVAWDSGSRLALLEAGGDRFKVVG